jgi:hypothetical protein
MEEFQKTYTVASIYRGIFMKALQQLFPDYALNASAPNPVADPISTDPTTGNLSLFNDSVMDTAFTDSLVDTLMDDASIFSFWESLNRM